MTIKTLIILAGGAMLGTAAPAQVIVTGEPEPTARVSYADLDLGSAAGKARLEQRIRSAADSLCFERTHEPVREKLQRKACFDFAVADGYRQMESAVAELQSGARLAAAVLTIRGK